ncbi:MAG: hypothetical protein IJ853_04570 [Rickettsiales bacterium]|nr:hypothetical protein [Rickettsiales bacterium]
MNKCLLITNPLSGKYSRKKAEFIVNELGRCGITVLKHELGVDEKVSDVIKNIDAKDINHIILAFGDGTINNACNALLARDDYEKFVISVMPLGTANILAMELNCDSIKRSIRAINNFYNNIGKTKKIHFGLVNGQYFVLMASAGFDSYAVRNTKESLKKKIGKYAYIYEFLKIVFKKDFRKVSATVDGVRYDGIVACVSNGKYYGIKLHITASDMSTNDFDLLVIKKISLISMIKYLFTKKSNRDIIYIKNVNRVIMDSEIKEYPLQIDGDYLCDLPSTVESTNKFLNFIRL